MMMVGALEEVSKALRDIKARQDQAEEEEQANIEKAREILGGEGDAISPHIRERLP